MVVHGNVVWLGESAVYRRDATVPDPSVSGTYRQYRKRPWPSQERQVPHGYSRPDCLSHVEKSDVMEAAIHHVSIQNKHSNTFLGSSRQNSHRIGISVPSSQSQDIRNTCGVPKRPPTACPMSLLIPERSTGFAHELGSRFHSGQSRNHERAAVVIGIPSPSPVTFDTTDPVLKCTKSIVIKLL